MLEKNINKLEYTAMNNDNQTISRPNILLVDDNPNNLRLLSNMLTDSGYQIRRAISGQMALQAAQVKDFDLIMLDINMPIMDGYETCHRLKADVKTANIPIIFISALNEVFDRVKAFQAGGSDYITKPFELEEVIVRVKNQVQISSLQKHLQVLNTNLEKKVITRTKELQTINKGLKQYQLKLLNKTLKDSVTNLGNKISFMGELRQAIKKLEREPDYCFALIIFDCYCPQLINQALDLKFEDYIAITIAEKLTDCLTSARTIARLENYEFVTIIDGVSKRDRAIEIARKVKKILSFSIKYHNQEFNIKVNPGISLSVKSSARSNDILLEARTKVRKAKNKSYYQYQKTIFDKSNVLSEKTKFEQAFKGEKITLLYQPIISVDNGKIKEIEVFFAWSELANKIITLPEVEAAIQQDDSLALATLKWMIKTAVNDFKKWQDIIIWCKNESHFDENMMIRFKLSEQQLLLPNFIEKLKKIIVNSQIERKYIILEIPELFVRKNLILGQQISEKLKKMGFYLSIENFSTDYLALDYQDNFLFDNCKITNYLTDKIDKYSQKKSIIKQIISLAHAFNMTVTTTNIETLQQFEFWKDLECEFVSGKFFSQPVISQEIEKLTTDNVLLTK